MPSLGDLTLKILLDIVTANKNAEEFGTSLKDVEAQTEKTKASVKKLGGEVEHTSESIDAATAKVKRLKNETSNSGKGVENFSSNLKNAGGEATAFGDSATVMGTGIAAAVTALGIFTIGAIKKGAEFDVLRRQFKGTAEDIELFRKATDATATDGSLIALSNHASSLNVSIADQAKFFFLAKRASDDYGGGLEENFMKVLKASDGSAEGLRDIGISVQSYKDEIDKLTLSTGQHLNALSAEEQQGIRMQAIFNLTGISIDAINSKTQSSTDKMKELSNVWDNFTTSLGLAIVQSGELGKGMDGVTQSVQDAGTKSGNFISTLISLGGWIQSVTDYIYPWIGAYNSLSDATQFLINKTKELMSTQEAQQSKQQYQFEYGGEGDIPLDEFGKPVPLKNRDAERSKYQNSKGTLGYKEQKDSGGNGSTRKGNDAKELLTFLEQINKEIEDTNNKISMQSEAESIAEGLFAKKKSLEQEKDLIHQISTGFQDYIKIRAEILSLPDTERAPETVVAIPEDKMLAFRIAIQDAEKQSKDMEESFNNLVSDLSVAYNLAAAIANTLTGSGKDFMHYVMAALQLAIQTASLIKKGNSKEGIGFMDVLGAIGTVLPFFFESGGVVPGPGSTDTVPAWLTPGESVLNKAATDRLGPGLIQLLNRGGGTAINVPQAVFYPSPQNAGGGELMIVAQGELTDHLNFKIVDNGMKIRNVRKINTTF